jgi:TetR/AcrR family transcriptional regulator
MGIVERREREKQRRREEILNAAEKVFFLKGIRHATMENVAEEAELSKGTLYLYFKSKEEIYLAINLRGLTILDEMFEKAVSKYEKGIEKIRAIGRSYYRFYKEYPDYFNAFLYYESHEMNWEDKDSVAIACDTTGHKAMDVVVEALRTGIADGTIRPDIDAFNTAVILWGYLTGIIQIFSLKGDHLREEHGLKEDEIVEYSFEFIGHALENKR